MVHSPTAFSVFGLTIGYGVTAIIMTVTVNPKHVISGLMQSVVMIEVVFSISLTIKVLKTSVVEI